MPVMGEATGVTQEELAWDHTAENTPLMHDHNRSNPFMFSSQTDAHLLLSGRHIDQLLRNLDDSATLLKNVLKNSARFPQDTTALSGVCSSRFRGLCNYSTRSVLWVTAGIQLLSATLVTILDAAGKNHKTATASITVLSILQAVNIIYFIFALVLLTRRSSCAWGNTPFSLVVKSYFSSILLFVGLYTLTYRTQATSWACPAASMDSDSALSIYVKMVYMSVATATLCGAPGVVPVVWFTYLLTSVQMLLSLTHIMQILALATRWQQSPPVLPPAYPVYGVSPLRGRSPSLISRSSVSSNTAGRCVSL
ncbi:hypothetical protein NP493_750g00020 [Ridgeia piscesae]|uniref:Uncharacterized protein n=1 Tax=Ridgeia piscesae TaxID=27915 RepID=A0AAD9KP24_RIDPI|nr:hypothetical protein NP493_750g00020 [Ridgeia piscesae]